MPTPTIAGTAPAQATLRFEDFFADNHLRLGRSLFLLTGDRAEAEDLVQEALGRALERWDRISIMAEPVGYVYRIATNLYRKRWRNRRLVRPFLERVEGSAPDPAVSVSAHADIVAALRRLPLEQRETVILVDLLGYDAAAAGAVLGIEPVSVRVRLHRARTALREWLGDGDD